MEAWVKQYLYQYQEFIHLKSYPTVLHPILILNLFRKVLSGVERKK